MHYSAYLFFRLGLLLLTLLPIWVKAQPITVAQADSLQQVLRQGKPDTTQVRILLRLGEYYGRKTWNAGPNLDSALVLAGQAWKLSQELAYAWGKEEATFLEGKILIKQEKATVVQQILKSVSEVNRIRLMLELGKQKLLETNTQKADWDTSLRLFRQGEQLSERLKNQVWQEESQRLIGITYLLKKDLSQSKAYFNKVIQARQNARDKSGEVASILKMVIFAMGTAQGCNNCVEQLTALNRALKLCRQMENKAQEEITLLLIGFTYYYMQRDFKEIEHLAYLALAIQKEIGYSAINRAWHLLMEENVYYPQNLFADFSNAYYLLIAISEYRKNFNQALLYYLQAAKEIERSGLYEELAYPYCLIGRTYFYLNQLNKSIEYYQKSLAVSHQKGEIVVVNGMIRWMAEAWLKVGKEKEALQLLENFMGQNLPLPLESKISIAFTFAQCYTALKQYQLAEPYYQQALIWSKQSPDPASQTIAKYYASRFYVETGKYTKAEPLLKSILAAKENKGLWMDYKEAYLLQFKVDSALAKYSSAIRYYQKYIALKDSVFTEIKSKQIEELGIRYETEKKEQQLRLKEKNIALLKEQNKAQQTQRNALIGGTLLLLSLLGLGYNRYRLKQRSNQQLKAQQQALQIQQQQIRQKNEDLQLLVEEKERLLREIHHRIKNNLQVVMSLLNSQAASLQDKAALSAIQESQHRVQAMALIHQKLYQSERVARIHMPSYIREVVAYLHESYSLSSAIRFELGVEDLELDVTQAVPLGLIINEAVTNAFKYAFPDGRSGTVTLKLRRLADVTYQLTIADDGVGLPADYDPARSRSLGMRLLHGFSAQLGGELFINSPPGLHISLVFTEVQPEAIPTSQRHAPVH